jgi:transcriptional regulator with XRE-family HTH domain
MHGWPCIGLGILRIFVAIVRLTGYRVATMYPDDTQKDLATVLSYMAGRTLSKEEIWKAMELPRSTYYDQLEKGTLITADNLRRAAANLGINRAELLTRYRLIDPEEVASLAEEIAGQRRPLLFPPSRTGGITETATTIPAKRATVSQSRPRPDAPPL